MPRIFNVLFLAIIIPVCVYDMRKLVNPAAYTGSGFIPMGFLIESEPFTDKSDSIILGNYILQQTKSHYLDEYPDVDYSDFRITGRYSLSNAPCVKLYSLETPGISHIIDFMQFTNLLINECDSSLYFFEDKLDKFVRLFSKDLIGELNNEGIINIIDLYLNSMGYISAYFILNSAKQIEIIYNRPYLRIESEMLGDTLNPIYMEYKRRQKGMAIAKEVVRPPVIERNGDTFTAKIYTFALFGDKIEYWQFRISEGEIEITNRIMIFDYYPAE